MIPTTVKSDLTIRDIIFLIGTDIVKNRSMPGMEDAVSYGIGAAGYNYILNPIIEKLAKSKLPTSNLDIVDIVTKFVGLPLAIGGTGMLLYGNKSFEFQKNMMKAGIVIGSQFIYDMIFNNKKIAI